MPQARVARAQARAAADLAVHQLATLSGQGAEGYASIQRPELRVQAALPVPAELPINLLARRPDVLSARLAVEAADEGRLAAKAAFYPDVSLRALAGFGAFGMSNLVQGSARGYGGGPLISLPLFDGGRLRAEYRGSEAQLDGAIASYNDTVLHAVQQTADQITRLDALAREEVDQQQTLESNEAAYKLAEERYRAGLASYLTVLNAETQVLAARNGLVDIQTSQVLARVTLLLAVGGTGGSGGASCPLVMPGTVGTIGGSGSPAGNGPGASGMGGSAGRPAPGAPSVTAPGGGANRSRRSPLGDVSWGVLPLGCGTVRCVPGSVIGTPAAASWRVAAAAAAASSTTITTAGAVRRVIGCLPPVRVAAVPMSLAVQDGERRDRRQGSGPGSERGQRAGPSP